jgi:Rho-binding antiterminator
MAIDCNIYDYVEIACLYNLSVVAQLKDNSKVAGIATTTIIKLIEHNDPAQNSKREECIVLQTESGAKLDVVLSQIVSLTCLDDNPHFRTLNFISGTLSK